VSLRLYGVENEPVVIPKDHGFVTFTLMQFVEGVTGRKYPHVHRKRVRGKHVVLPPLPAGTYHCEFDFEFGSQIERAITTLIVRRRVA